MRLRRLISRSAARRSVPLRNGEAIISFTFDDFPRSALVLGGEILRKYGVTGTYFASLGLMGGLAPAGEMFSASDLKQLVADGHELGCHTHDHLDSWETGRRAFERSIVRNRERLRELLTGCSFAAFSYPINWPSPANKLTAGRFFGCCRGGGQEANVGKADLSCLNAFFLEQAKGSLEGVYRIITEARRARGWLILATHDVDPTPTRLGCDPQFFEQVVRLAKQSGAAVLPVHTALERIQ